MRVAIFHNLPSGGAKRALWGNVRYLSAAGCSIDVFVPSTADEDFLPLRQFANSVTVIPVHPTPFGLAKSAIKHLFPRGLFPEDISEGDVVSIDIEIDKESTSDRKKKMEEKLKKLIEKK